MLGTYAPRDDMYIFKNNDENENLSEKFKDNASGVTENIKEFVASLEYALKILVVYSRIFY